MEIKIGIYKYTSPSNRVYIGKSKNIYYYRSYKYKKLNCKSQPKLYRSLKKYGYETHQFEILEECTKELLNEREIFYKKQELDKVNWDWKKVLFCDLADVGGGPRSEETKRKISKANKGRKRSKETRLKMSKSFKGKRKSEETKKRMSESKLGKKITWSHKFNKIILQYDLQGNFIKEWKSITSASNELKLRQGDISNVCIGTNKSCGKFMWRYKKGSKYSLKIKKYKKRCIKLCTIVTKRENIGLKMI